MSKIDTLITIFKSDELSVELRVILLKRIGNIINFEVGHNLTEEFVIELILALDPCLEPEIAKDKHLGNYLKEMRGE